MSKPLPVIVGIGGMNPGGRSSHHMSYLRQVYDALPNALQQQVITDLRALDFGDETRTEEQLLAGTLVRKIEKRRFDVDAVPTQVSLRELDQPLKGTISSSSASHLPRDKSGKVQIDDPRNIKIETTYEFPVKGAAQIPDRFDPNKLYQSRNHPLAIALSIFGVTDMLGHAGLDWQSDIASRVSPDRMAALSGSAIGQVDPQAMENYLAGRRLGQRVKAHSLAFGLPEMSADFVHAYALQSLGRTGHVAGACATFLFNLQVAAEAIENGSLDVAVVGAADAHVLATSLEGFHATSALAADEKILALQQRTNQQTDTPIYRNMCRPFGDNCGFSMGESAQFMLLMSDKLALELGANILGAVGGSFVHADGGKTSITKPGPGNYITVARAFARAQALIGADGLQNNTFMLAHGTGTPANRVSESQIFSKFAQTFGIKALPVGAPKCQLGHSMAAAAGDASALGFGVFEHGILPGIVSTPELAPDISREGLDFVLEHRQTDASDWKAFFVNAKGFGGNNATTVYLSAPTVLDRLKQRHGNAVMTEWQQRNEVAHKASNDYSEQIQKGDFNLHYNLSDIDIEQQDVIASHNRLRIDKLNLDMPLDDTDPFN